MKKTSLLSLFFIGVMAHCVPISSLPLPLQVATGKEIQAVKNITSVKAMSKAPTKPASSWQSLSTISQHKKAQKVTHLLKHGNTIGDRVVNFAKNIASPVKAVQEQYHKLVDKYISTIILGKIDPLADEMEKEIISSTPNSPFVESLQKVKRETLPEIKKRITEWIDKTLKSSIQGTTNSLLIPFLAQTYKIPIEKISYSAYKKNVEIEYNIASLAGIILHRGAEKEDLGKAKKEIKEYYIKVFARPLDYLNLDTTKIKSAHLNSIIPKFIEILGTDNDKAQEKLTTLKSNIDKNEFKDGTNTVIELPKKSAKTGNWVFFSKANTGPTKAPEQTEMSIGQFKQQIFWAQEQILEKFHNKLAKNDPVSYADTLKKILLPAILLTHFNGKIIPGVIIDGKPVEINQANHTNGTILKAIDALQEKVKGYKEKVDTYYKKYQKFAKGYEIIVDMTEAFSTVIELSNNPEADNYFSRVADAVAKVVKSTDNLMYLFDIEVYEFDSARLSKGSSLKRTLQKNDTVKKESVLITDEQKIILSKLRFILQKYKSLHDFIIRAFVEKLDVQGHKIRTLNEGHLIATVKEIIKPKVLEYLQGKLKDIMIERFGPLAGPAFAELIIGAVKTLPETLEQLDKEEMMLEGKPKLPVNRAK